MGMPGIGTQMRGKKGKRKSSQNQWHPWQTILGPPVAHWSSCAAGQTRTGDPCGLNVTRPGDPTGTVDSTARRNPGNGPERNPDRTCHPPAADLDNGGEQTGMWWIHRNSGGHVEYDKD